MTPVQLIGFSERDYEITKGLAENDCLATRVENTRNLQAEHAVFVSAEATGWVEIVKEIRALYPHTFLVAVTRIPDSSKWLEALAAGADDYCALPLQRQHVQGLIDSFKRRSGVYLD